MVMSNDNIKYWKVASIQKIQYQIYVYSAFKADFTVYFIVTDITSRDTLCNEMLVLTCQIRNTIYSVYS